MNQIFHFALNFFFLLFLDAQKMPVSDIISSNRHHLSSLTDNRNNKYKKKQFDIKSKSSQKDDILSSKDVEELKFFKVDKNFWRTKVIQQYNNNNKNSKSSAYEKENSNNNNNKKFNVERKSQGQKRKIIATAFCDSKKLKTEEDKSDEIVDNSSKMYDYRSSSSIKTENDYINSKNGEDEENMINTFYQQRYLGGANNSIATLCNIGNSCYLNSVIYTLRFAPYFLHKLHHLCDDMHYVYQKIGQNKLKSSSLGRNVGGLQVCKIQNGE